MTLDRAQYFVELKRYKEARAEVMKVLAVEPHNSDAFALLAYCTCKLGKKEEAYKHAKKAAALNPASSYAQSMMSNVCLLPEDYKGAETAAREAIRLDPENADGYGLLALTLRCTARWDDALDVAKQGLQIDPIDIDCLTALAECLSILSRHEEALDAARKLVTTHPEEPHSHSYAGWVVLRMGQTDKAADHFREALRLDPTFEWARQGLIEALRSRTRFYRWIIPAQTWRMRWHRNIVFLLPLSLVALVCVLDLLTGVRFGFFFWVMAIGLVGYAIMFFGSLLQPILNLLILAHPYGRLALSREDKCEAAMFGIAVPSVAASLLIAWATGNSLAAQGFLLGLTGLILAVVISKAENTPRKYVAACICGYAGAAIALALSIIGLFKPGFTIWPTI